MKQLMEKWKTGPGEKIAILVLAGILLLVIAIPVEKEEKYDMEIAAGEGQSMQLSRREELEEQLELILEQVKGVGKAEVMLSLKSDGQKIVEKDMQIEENLEEKGESSDLTVYEQRNSSEETVYERDGQGREIPYVTEIIEPEITGVLIAAQGAGNLVTVNEITEAVMALFGVEAHKIKVMKME